MRQEPTAGIRRNGRPPHGCPRKLDAHLSAFPAAMPSAASAGAAVTGALRLVAEAGLEAGLEAAVEHHPEHLRRLCLGPLCAGPGREEEVVRPAGRRRQDASMVPPKQGAPPTRKRI